MDVFCCRYNNLRTAAPAAPLDSLLILNLAHNKLETVLDETGYNWSRLAVLNVSFNELRSLPSSIGAATRLQQLYVANNQLESLPTSFGALPLVDLFLSENALRCVAVSVWYYNEVIIKVLASLHMPVNVISLLHPCSPPHIPTEHCCT
jgi:Leucine rich repeat